MGIITIQTNQNLILRFTSSPQRGDHGAERSEVVIEVRGNYEKYPINLFSLTSEANDFLSPLKTTSVVHKIKT